MKKHKFIKFIIVIIMIIYISCYYVACSGYYEYHMQQKTILTNQKIKEFELDVKENKDIDIKNYLDYEEKDYSSRLSNFMYDMSNSGVKISRKVIKTLFKKLRYLVEDE